MVELTNKNVIVFRAQLESQDIACVSLGMLNTNEVPFKGALIQGALIQGALILASSLRGLITPSHGWPV